MWNCKNCGNENRDNRDHCWSCGMDRAQSVKINNGSKIVKKHIAIPDGGGNPESQNASQEDLPRRLPMQKWEYTYLFINGEGNKLYQDGEVIASGKSLKSFPYVQRLGEQGWEMVAVVSESVSKCVGGSAWSSEVWGGIRWYFKRPKN